MDLPIACTLSEEELAERRRTLLDSLRAVVVRVSRVETGYVYEFQRSPEMLATLRRLVELEEQCCRFLAFAIAENETALSLTVTGPQEAISMVEDLFGSQLG